MSEGRYQIVLYERQRRFLTLEELASAAGVHPELVQRFLEYGLIEPLNKRGSIEFFDVEAVVRLRTIVRIRRDLGINLAGVGVILDLIDRLRMLRRENEQLRARL